MACATSAVSRRSPLLAGGVLLAALLAAGCASDPGGEPVGGGKPSGGGKASGKPAATESPRNPSSRPPTSAPAPPPLTASDGTDYSACAGGTCEVAVSGPVDVPVAGGTFTVKKVTPGDGVTFTLESDFGGGNGTVKGRCGTVLNFYPGGGGMISKVCEEGTTPSPPAPEPMLKLQLVGWDPDDAAVIRFVSSD